MAAKKLSPAREEFLQNAARPQGMSSVDYYPPCKWAVENHYVTEKKGRFGGSTYHITDEGRKLLPPSEPAKQDPPT